MKKRIFIMDQIKGIFAASMSILNENLTLNTYKTIIHAENLIKQGCHGVAIFGSTGQAQLIPISEKINLLNKLSTNKIDWPMLYTDNPVVLQPGMVFFMHMILMDSENELAMNLGETYLITPSGNERLGKKKLDLVIG